jgi:hypothetical protein
VTWSAAVASERDRPGDRQVYRTTGSRVLWSAWLVFAVVSLVALAITGRNHAALVTALLIIAITGIAYACAHRPRVVADDTGITVVNPLRAHAVPWAAVTKVDLTQTLRVHHTPSPGSPGESAGGPAAPRRERVVHSWAVQSSARARARGELRTRRAARQAPPEAGYAKLPEQAREALQGSAGEFIARQLDERAGTERRRAGPGSPPVTQVRWAWPAMAAMAVPLLALIVAAAA